MTATVERPTTTSELLLEWDRRRPRSQQQELGMSELGGCRRRAGYRLAGTSPTNAGGSVQAVLGTAVHEAVATVFRDLQADGVLSADDLIEHEVRFAGIIGHLDRYQAAEQKVIDTKTTSSRWLAHIKTHLPDLDHRFQVSCYAAALVAQGIPVKRIRIEYVARDTGEEWPWEVDFDPAVVVEALAWLTNVRNTELGMLPRDHEPQSAFCQHCPFLETCWSGGVPDRDPRSVLYVEDPDAAKWAEQLWQARKDKKAATAREAEAKGALDALRPDLEEGQSAAVNVGWRLPLLWRKKRGARSLDKAAVEAEYAKTGAKPPIKVAKGALELVFEGDDGEKE